MNRKKILCGIVLLSIMILSIFYSNAFCEEVGRYQLFQGQYRFINIKGEEYWSKALFKIDTVNGEVWIGNQYQYKDPETGKGIQIRDWTPFKEKLPLAKY